MQRVIDIVDSDLQSIGYPITIRLRVGFESEFPNDRDYAYTYEVDGHLIVVFAPKMLKASEDRIKAIMRHEIGHAIFMSKGNHHHSEQQVDDLAERLWGDRLYYDHQDIQTLRRGQYPRPKHLHQ